MTEEINGFFSNITKALTEGFSMMSDFVLDYLFLIIAIGCWIRFCSQLFLRGNFSGLLLLFAIVTTAAAAAMGQLFWKSPFF